MDWYLSIVLNWIFSEGEKVSQRISAFEVLHDTSEHFSMRFYHFLNCSFEGRKPVSRS